jgi:hypothetical protein
MGVFGDVFGNGVGFFELFREFAFGSLGKVDEDDGRVGPTGDLSDKAVVSFFAAEDPSAAVEIDDDREDAGAFCRADRSDIDFLIAFEDLIVFDKDRELVNGLRLEVF